MSAYRRESLWQPDQLEHLESGMSRTSVEGSPLEAAGVRTYMAADGSGALYQAPDGFISDSAEEIAAYVERNQVGMLVTEFMAHVGGDLVTYFGDKDGNLPSERALLALQTRLKNNAAKVLEWYVRP